MTTSEAWPPVVFDNDCLSSFLWSNTCDLLTQLFARPILVPAQVVAELDNLRSFRAYVWVCESLDMYVADGRLTVCDIEAGTPAAVEYVRLTESSARPIGSGEAAALIIARERGGTVASNNLKDVLDYCRRYSVNLVTTRDILCLCLDRGFIDLAKGEEIWRCMRDRRRWLPEGTFADNYRRFRTGI